MAEKDIGKVIRKTLVAGVAVSTALIVMGLTAHFFPGGQHAGKALVTAGLMALLFTPLARVAMLLRAFHREGLTRYAFAAGAVLLIMLAGLFAK